MPSVNHPNFGWAISADELASVQRTKLFELYNGHPLVNNQGGGGVPGLEEVWDRLLSSGKLLYGIAVDDAHHFKRPWDATASSPGHGWVYVRSAALEPRPLVEALERGDFYSSTGVVLGAVDASAKRLRVSVTQAGTSKYRIQFIGQRWPSAAGSGGSRRRLHVQGRRGLRPRESAGVERRRGWTQPVGVGAQAPR